MFRDLYFGQIVDINEYFKEILMSEFDFIATAASKPIVTKELGNKKQTEANITSQLKLGEKRNAVVTTDSGKKVQISFTGMPSAVTDVTPDQFNKFLAEVLQKTGINEGTPEAQNVEKSLKKIIAFQADYPHDFSVNISEDGKISDIVLGNGVKINIGQDGKASITPSTKDFPKEKLLDLANSMLKNLKYRF
jgi:hypothetical protein